MFSGVLRSVVDLVVIIGVTLMAAVLLHLVSYNIANDQVPWAYAGLRTQATENWDTAAVRSDRDESDGHQKRRRDIYHVAFLLRQKLVPDLVPAILEFAQFFESRTSSVHLGNGLKVSETHSPFELIVSGPIESNVRVRHPVRTVVFEIESHDQGFASRRDAGTWTWFTAAIRRRSCAEHDTPEDMGAMERELYRNPMADDFWRTHVIQWQSNSINKDESEWVSSLRVGDRISVSAQARFPAWTNYVRSVKVTVETVGLAG